MPLYEYQCAKCHKRTEKIENLSGPYLKKCPHCGGKLERTLTAPSIQFKGSGWYINDYAAKPKGDGEGATPAKTDSKEAPKESADKESAAKESTAKDSASKDSKEKKPSKKKD